LTRFHAVDISSDSKESKPGFNVPKFIEKLHMKNIQEDALRQSHRGGSYFLPVKDLILERSACYGDMFTPRFGMADYYGPIWDSEHLESLELNNMKISDFLAPIPLEQFSSIRRLKIKGTAGQEGQAMEEANSRLAELLEVCQQLEELEVKYDHWHYLFKPINVINVRGKTLRKLHLRDLDNNQARRAMTTHSLRQIQASCTGLVDMALDVNMHATDVSYGLIRPAADINIRQASEFLNILARFPNLRKLELTAETDLANYPNVRDKVDPDFDSTKVIFKQLQAGKIGPPFHEITIHIVHCPRPHGNRGNHYDPYYSNSTRVFKYGVNGRGRYEQWGSTRFPK
jgi:hypothetical protein